MRAAASLHMVHQPASCAYISLGERPLSELLRMPGSWEKGWPRKASAAGRSMPEVLQMKALLASRCLRADSRSVLLG